jgi:AbrB family looped-hinge helix DNA binding protein
MASSVTKALPAYGRINESGRIVIPAAIRRQMGIEAGDRLLMEVQDGVLRIESHRARIRRIQEEFKRPMAPGEMLMSDRLIADRREEARRELEESLG